VAEHGLLPQRGDRLLHREIVGGALDVRCRVQEATAVIDTALIERGIGPGELALGTDNGTAFTSRVFRAQLAEHGVAHRRGGYRDPESQAFIESWFAKLHPAPSAVSSDPVPTAPGRRAIDRPIFSF
jgi:transposase InsO family protein